MEAGAPLMLTSAVHNTWVWLGVVLTLAAVWDLGKRIKSVVRWWRRHRFQLTEAEQSALVASLNAAFADRAEIACLLRSTPELSYFGAFDASEAVRQKAGESRAKLDEEERNELHALLTALPSWDTQPVRLQVRTADFATILAARAVGDDLPPIVTSNAIVTCSARDRIYVMRRSGTTATFPGALHIFGGNLRAEGRRVFDRSFSDVAAREILEEMGVVVQIADDTRSVATFEWSAATQRDFFQVTYLGIDLSAADADRIRDSEEGEVQYLSLAELGDHVCDVEEQWVPSGLMNVLLWLGLGAPTAGTFLGFSPKQARSIVDRWLALPR